MSWPLPGDTSGRLRLALGYPFARSAAAFCVRGGRVESLPPDATAGREPVLAHGSNRAPAQLARKFAGWTTPLPVSFAWLHGRDVVYAAHFARYGAITATLAPARGCRVCVAITWLTPAQRARMDDTEGAYACTDLDPAALTPGDGPLPTGRVTVYQHPAPPLRWQGDPVALAAVPACDRPYPALHQAAVQRLARDRLAPETPCDTFILETIADAELRRRRADELG